MTEKFKDYPAEQIQAKLKQIDEFEAKYGPKATSNLGVNGVLTTTTENKSGRSVKTLLKAWNTNKIRL